MKNTPTENPPKSHSPDGAGLAPAPCSLRIFRVQDRSGRGPFRPGLTDKWSENWRPPAIDSIPPFSELLKVRTLGFRGFGCEKIEDLANWICADEFKTLRKMGFRVVSIEVDKIHWRDNFNCFFSSEKPLSFRVRKERFHFSANAQAELPRPENSDKI